MIKYWLYQIDQWQSNRLITYAVVFAMLLAGWMQYIQHGWINPDSVLYFEQAKRFVQGDFAGMIELFNWPLYGMCIGVVHTLTGLSIHFSAQFLNVVFFGIATLSFLNLIKLLGGNQRTLFFAAALLFSAQYIVGDVLEMLMRDEGFWAFYLTGLYFFVRFVLQQKTRDALLWQMSIIVATLFRLEAILYLLFLPILVLLVHPTLFEKRLLAALKSYAIVISIGIAIAVFFMLNPELSMSDFGRLKEVFSVDVYSTLTTKLYSHADIMGAHVLGDFLDEFSVAGLLVTFVMVILVKSVVATGIWSTGLAYFSIKKTNAMHPTAKRILLITMAIGLTTAFIIIVERFVLSKRYIVAIVWILMLFASFQLTKLSIARERKAKIFVLFMMVLMLAGFIKNVLPKKDGYNYRQDAIAWLTAHKVDQQNVFYDDNRLIYYADAPFIGRWTDNWGFLQDALATGTLQQHKWVAITHNIKHPEHLRFIAKNLPEYQEIKRFADRKQRKFVIIYQRKTH